MSFIIRPSKKNNILTLSTKAIQYLGMISRRWGENSNMKQPPTSSKRGTVIRGGSFRYRLYMLEIHLLWAWWFATEKITCLFQYIHIITIFHVCGNELVLCT